MPKLKISILRYIPHNTSINQAKPRVDNVLQNNLLTQGIDRDFDIIIVIIIIKNNNNKKYKKENKKQRQ